VCEKRESGFAEVNDLQAVIDAHIRGSNTIKKNITAACRLFNLVFKAGYNFVCNNEKIFRTDIEFCRDLIIDILDRPSRIPIGDD
jgi:hypothetical protein